MRLIRGIWKVEFAAAAVVTAVCALFLPRGGGQERDVTGRPFQDPTGGYVGSQTCRACHPSQYASWRGSFHRTMTQVASPDTAAASFDGVTVAAAPGEPMVLEQRGRELWADFVDPDAGRVAVDSTPGGDRVRTKSASNRITRQVVMITGSHHQQIYWYATGNSRVLGQLPAIWLTADRRWIPRGAAVMRPPGGSHVSETGAWNGVCVACHATDGQPRFDTLFGSQPVTGQTADTRAAEFGVACEACHGPGADHARANRSPARRYSLHFAGRPDPTIVQPMRLSARLSSQVCGQCHALWELTDAQSARQANQHGMPYRPGDPLSATRFIVQPTTNLDSPAMRGLLAGDAGFVRDIFWSDGMVRATGREYNGLIDSPCYKNATDDRRTLTCFSCHTMHKTDDDRRPISAWADDQVAPRAAGNNACAPCHAPQANEAHTHHRAESAGSSCYNCHMPYTTYGLLKTIRSHQISSPSAAATLQTGRPNACNLCHLDRTLAWSAERLTQWYGAAMPALGDDDRQVAASLVALLKGDAGQRAIVAQSMGWPPAQRASGTAWLTPYLALMSKDGYDAVRYIAARALLTLPPFRRDQLPRGAPHLLINADGAFDTEVVNRLVRARDNRRVFYR